MASNRVIHIEAGVNEFPVSPSWLTNSAIDHYSVVVLAPEGFDCSEIDENLLHFFDSNPQAGAAEITPGEGRSLICSKVSGIVTAFRGSILLDYHQWWSEKSEHILTRQDCAIYLNKLGYSLYELPLLSNFGSQIPQENIIDSNNDKSWDAYINHISNDWDAFSLNHQLEPIKNSLLLDARTLDPINNGTARVTVGFLRNLALKLEAQEFENKPVLLVRKSTAKYFSLDQLGFEIKESLEADRATYDIAISVSPVTTLAQAAEISFRSKTWAVIHLDLIAVRSLELLSQNAELLSATSFYMDTSTRLYFISNSALSDATNVFSELHREITDKSVCCHLGIDSVDVSYPKSVVFPKDEYVFVLGNHYPHKQVARVTESLLAEGICVVTIGSEDFSHPLHISIDSAEVTDEKMTALIAGSTVCVFPSLYEGFGLPILEIAALGKPLVLWETSTSREVASLIRDEIPIIFVTSIKELTSEVSTLINNKKSPSFKISPQRSMSEFSDELLNDLLKFSSRPDEYSTNARRRFASHILRTNHSARINVSEELSSKHWKTRISKILKPLFR